MSTLRQFLLLTATISMLLFAACNSSSEKKQAETDSASTLKTQEHTPIDVNQYDRFYNDISRLLAGRPQEAGSSLASLDTNSMVTDHQQSINEFFDAVNQKSLSRMEEFATSELAQANNNLNTLFYPFSGPDFIHSDVFFPHAKTTIMLGLEPVGNLPSFEGLNDLELKDFFKAVRIAIDSIKHLGYFMTFEMSRDFKRVGQLNGTLPIIAMFVSQRGYRVLEIKKITLDEKGNVVDSIPGQKDLDDPFDPYISGCVIKYMKEGDTSPREIYYFSHDASDASLQKTPGFAAFVNRLKPEVTFLKAASYLMSWMKTMRELAMNNSDYIFQDDSGIPYKFFDRSDWQMQFYGRYRRTLKVFYNAHFQSELKQIYETDTTIKPLDFGIGYGVRIRQSNLMLATKK